MQMNTKLLQMQAFPLIEPHTQCLMVVVAMWMIEPQASESMHELQINRKLDTRMVCFRHVLPLANGHGLLFQ